MTESMTPSNPSLGRAGRSARPVQRMGLVALLVAATLGGGALLRSGAAVLPADELPRLFHSTATGPVSFHGELDRTAVMPPGDGQVRIELVLGAEKRAAGARVPTDLVVVLDTSGSMNGEKIGHAKAAIRVLVEQLAPEDRFGLVTYANGSTRRIGLQPLSHGAREHWLASVHAIQAQGGTNLAAGLDAGLQLMQSSRRSGRAPRMILISDGLANQGDTSPSGLRNRAGRVMEWEAVLSTVGVGADFDGELMASLADSGAGNFHYLENAVSLAEVFAAEFETSRETVASALEVSIDPASGVRIVDAAGYPLRHDRGVVHFSPGHLFSGQERRVWVTLEVSGSEPGVQELADFRLSYRADGEPWELGFDATPRIARVADPEVYYSQVDTRTWERSVIVDAVSSLKREVANDVAAGRAPAALEKVQRYRAGLASQNAELKSKKVDEALEDMDELRQQLDGHVAGEVEIRPEEVQQLRALGYAVGRPGSRK